MLPSCFSCFGSALRPPDHYDYSREELKQVYEKSIVLNNGRLIVHGIFARADTRNNNKRVYPKKILKREVTKFDLEHIKCGTAMGELDHPNYQSRFFKCLNLPNISHQVLEVHWKKDQLWGTIEILPTPSGLLLWELYSQGIRLGVSSRGWASLRSDPKQRCIYVDDDFELITFDFVTEPSTKGAFLIPLKKQYKHLVPNQSRYVQIAHLGYGVVSMKNITKLPDPSTLVLRVGELKHIHQAPKVTQQQEPGYLSPPNAAATNGVSVAAKGLDKLLLFSHYVVHQEDKFLDRETHFRDYRAHLAMFATRAHLADKQLGKIDINAVILQELAKDEASVNSANRQSVDQLEEDASGDSLSANTNGSRETVETPSFKPTINPDLAGDTPNDLESWSMHPNALCLTPKTPSVAESARRAQETPSSDSSLPQAVAKLCATIDRPQAPNIRSDSQLSHASPSDVSFQHGQGRPAAPARHAEPAAVSPANSSGRRTPSPVDLKAKPIKQPSLASQAKYAPPSTTAVTQSSSAAAMAAAAAGPGVDVNQVVAEFQKIKKTLAAFAGKYQQYQGHVHSNLLAVKPLSKLPSCKDEEKLRKGYQAPPVTALGS